MNGTFTEVKPEYSPPDRVVVWLLRVLAVVLLGVTLYAGISFASAASSGFDLTDESFYLLDARHPEDQFAAPRLHWILTSPLLRLAGGDLASHRIAGAAALASVGAVLASCLATLIGAYGSRPGRISRRIAAVVVGAAALSAFYGFAIRTPGYNWGSLLLTAATLAAIAWSAAPNRRWSSSPAAGFFAGLALLPKLSTGLCLVAASATASAAIGGIRGGSGASITRGLASLTGSVAGVASGLAVLRIWGDPVEVFRVGSEMLAPTALYSELADRLRVETIEFLNVWWREARFVVAASGGLALLAAILTVLRRDATASVVALVGLPAAVTVLGGLGIGWEHLGGGSRIVLVSASVVVAAWVPHIGTRSAWRALASSDGWVVTGMLILLSLVPMATAAGTGNSGYWRQASFGFWLLAAALPALRGLGARAPSVVVAGAGLLSIVSLVAMHVIEAPAKAPYRPPADASGELEAIEIYAGSGPIEIDRELAASIRELRRLAADSGMSAGQDILACFDMPGLVLTLDGRAPGTSWLFSGYLRSDLAAARALASVPEARRRDAWVLVRSPQRAEARKLEGATPDLATLFATIGRKWPEDYMPVGSVRVPFYDRTAEVTLWRPRCIATPIRGDAQIPVAVASRSSEPRLADLADIDRVRSTHGGGAESGYD